LKEWITGRNPVFEALRANRRHFFRLLVASGVDEKGRLQEIIQLAGKRRLMVERAPRQHLDKLDENHQGVALQASVYPYSTLPDILELAKQRGEPPFILVLDTLQNPQNLGSLMRTAEAVAPSILWLDEIEKGFSGTKSSGESDAGTTARVFASFITWLQEKSTPVFVIATANDVSMLPPELLRKGRFDEIFFVDLPQPAEREEIFRIHLRQRGRDPGRFDLKELAKAAEGFAGAEIEQSVIAAMFEAFTEGREVETRDVLRALKSTVPLSETMEEQIKELRDWARTRARPASLDTSLMDLLNAKRKE
jgi:hypothetical protein